jgi:tetratricopeptide (TPR) repeat protein
MEIPFNYPPKDILNLYRKNFELIILWMLHNNDDSTWSDLTKIVNKSTLSIYLNKFLAKDREYVEKRPLEVDGRKTNVYSITTKGRERFYELSQAKQKRRLSYPPKTILRQRNYDHWILWMVYNNNYCKWNDFLKEPLSINQSSLSKNINTLLNEGFVSKEKKEYRITKKGKAEYANVLRQYDLDRQSILEAESKRIREITKKTIGFFERFQITEDDIKFRYLNNVLKLPYENDKIKASLDSEESFNKVLLFLSINHPDAFPTYISLEEFSREYNINQVKLDFAILRIVEDNIYPVKFFKLELEDGKNYYFQSGEKLERMLNAITEDHITRFTYLNNLYEESLNDTSEITLESTVEAILDDISDTLFFKGLRKALKRFLPDYIHYLAYKIEKEKKLIETYDKLEGLIWQEIETYSIDKHFLEAEKGSSINYKDALTEINQAIRLNPKNKDLYYRKSKILIELNQYKKSLNVLGGMFKEFPDEERNIQIKRAYVLRQMKNNEAGLEIINDLIQKYPKDYELLNYKAFWLQFLNKREESIDLIEELIKKMPNNATYHDTYGEILMFFQAYDQAIEQFSKVIELSNNEWYINQTYIKLGICYKELENYDLAVENLEKGKDLTIKNPIDPETKQKWLAIVNLFLEEIKLLL